MRTPGTELSVRGTAAEAVGLYLRHWKLLVPLAVAVLLPQAVLASALGDLNIDKFDSVGDLLKLLAIPGTIVISLAGEALLAGVVTGLVLQWRAKRQLPGPVAFVKGLPWGRLIAVDLLLAFGATAGLVLLVAPGLVFFTYFAIAPAVIEIERRTVRDALRRSASLVRGRFGQVFVLVIGLILATEVIAKGLLLIFHGFLGELASEVAVDALLESIQALVIALVAISLIELHE